MTCRRGFLAGIGAGAASLAYSGNALAFGCRRKRQAVCSSEELKVQATPYITCLKACPYYRYAIINGLAYYYCKCCPSGPNCNSTSTNTTLCGADGQTGCSGDCNANNCILIDGAAPVPLKHHLAPNTDCPGLEFFLDSRIAGQAPYVNGEPKLSLKELKDGIKLSPKTKLTQPSGLKTGCVKFLGVKVALFELSCPDINAEAIIRLGFQVSDKIVKDDVNVIADHSTPDLSCYCIAHYNSCDYHTITGG
jgi:hypothetical protein